MDLYLLVFDRMSACPPTNIGPGATSRKTYDTDSLVMRRIFAYDPMTNSPVSTNYILSGDTKGAAHFKSPLEVLSTFGWANLPDQVLSTQILTVSSVSSMYGYLASTVSFFQPYYPSSQQIFLPSTVNGLGTMGYISSTQLTSTLDTLASLGYVSSTQLTSSLQGLASIGYISSSQLTSTTRGLTFLGYVSSSQLTSTIQGLGTIGYLSSGIILTPINSTVIGLGTSGFISSSQFFSTVQGLGSAGYISTVNYTSTIGGLGSSGYISSTQLLSTVTGLGSTRYISSTQLTSTIDNLGTTGYISSASLYSTVAGSAVLFTSTSAGLGTAGYVSSTQLRSTVVGLGTVGFLSSPVFSYLSTVSISSATIVTSTISTFALNATLLTIGSNQFPFFFTSSVQGLGSATYVSTTQLTSSLLGLTNLGYVSSIQLFSTVTGLGSARYISSTQLTSTIDNLGTTGYISSASLYSTVAGSASLFASTTAGLGTAGYISSTQLYSTLAGLASYGFISTAQLTSTVSGLANSGYVSSTQLTSTLDGLATTGYVSTTQLTSTVRGLATSGYVSSTQLFSSLANFVSIRSTFNNNITGNWSNINFLYQNLTIGSSTNIMQFDMGPTFRTKMVSGAANCKLDIETKMNLQFSYYDTNSRDYQFNTFLVRGSNFITSNIIGQECMNYYILNTNPINLPFFFQEKNRFIISDSNILSTLKYQSSFSTLSVYNTFGPNVPGTNQFFASPASTACVTVVLDNLPTP